MGLKRFDRVSRGLKGFHFVSIEFKRYHCASVGRLSIAMEGLEGSGMVRTFLVCLR